MLFSHFLPSVHWNAVIRTLEVKAPPTPNTYSASGRGFQTVRKQHLCLFSAKGCVWIGFTEYLPKNYM